MTKAEPIPFFEHQGITIYNGDSSEILQRLTARFDLLLTDPPYGIGEASGKNKSRTKLAVSKDYGNDSWDDSPPSAEMLGRARGMADLQIIFGGNYFDLPPASCWLVWDKDNGKTDFADCELAWTNLKKAVRKFKYRWQGMLQEPGRTKEARVHPTQKPLALMRWCLKHAPKAKTVIDPFMGSGTTLEACLLEGRSCVGIEQSEKYCEHAANRISQGVLF